MPEELRIVVVDSVGTRPPAGPTAPAAGSSRMGGPPPFSATGAATGAAGARVGAAKPPPFVQPPPVQSQATGAAAVTGGAAAAGATAVVGAVAAVAAGLAVAVVAVKKFAKAVEAETDRLAGLSGPVAAAQAQTQITREMALLRRAQRIGPELARAERLRARFEKTATDLWTEVLAVLLKILEWLESIGASTFERIDGLFLFVAENKDAIKLALRAIGGLGVIAAEGLDGFLKLSKFLVNRFRDDEDEMDPFIQQFINLLGPAGGPAFGPGARPPRQPGLGV